MDDDEKVLDDVEEAEDAVDGGGVSSTTINGSLSGGNLLGLASSSFSYVSLFASRSNIFLGFDSFFGECLECALADEKWLITSIESVVVSIENEIDSDESMTMVQAGSDCDNRDAGAAARITSISVWVLYCK